MSVAFLTGSKQSSPFATIGGGFKGEASFPNSASEGGNKNP